MGRCHHQCRRYDYYSGFSTNLFDFGALQIQCSGKTLYLLSAACMLIIWTACLNTFLLIQRFFLEQDRHDRQNGQDFDLFNPRGQKVIWTKAPNTQSKSLTAVCFVRGWDNATCCQ